MCKCEDRFNFEKVKQLAIRYSQGTGEKVAVYKRPDDSFNYCPFDFSVENQREIVYFYPETEIV